MEEYLQFLQSRLCEVCVNYSSHQRAWSITIRSRNGMEYFQATDSSMEKVLKMAKDSTYFKFVPDEIRNHRT